MKKIVLCLIILAFTSCNKKNMMLEQKPQVKQSNEHLSKKDTISGNEYIFYFKKEKPVDSKNTYCNLDSIIVLKNDKKYVLNLLNKKISIGDGLVTDGVYDLDDYNFDGVNDIMLYPHRENHSVYSVEYRADYFLYNKKNDRFENNAQLDSLFNLNICKKDKYLTSNDGASFFRKYRWKGDFLELIEEIKQTELENGSYKIKINNIHENKQKEYIAVKSVISDFQCE